MDEPQNTSGKEFRGLYKNVKISVKTLDKIIIVGVIAIVLVLAFGLSNRGYTVEFDSMGGTRVPSQTRFYGELVEQPEPPTMEGWSFTGWYADENCTVQWDMGADLVYGNLKLYAGWEANTP